MNRYGGIHRLEARPNGSHSIKHPALAVDSGCPAVFRDILFLGIGLEADMKSSGEGESQTKVPQGSPEEPVRKRRRIHWVFPLGIGLAGLASAAAFIMRGCWHSNMSWPARAEDEHGDFSYQVCMDCGIMRLFDERKFRGVGPYGYDLHALIAGERLLRRQRMLRAEQQRSRLGEKSKSPAASAADSGRKADTNLG